MLKDKTSLSNNVIHQQCLNRFVYKHRICLQRNHSKMRTVKHKLHFSPLHEEAILLEIQESKKIVIEKWIIPLWKEIKVFLYLLLVKNIVSPWSKITEFPSDKEKFVLLVGIQCLICLEKYLSTKAQMHWH